MTKLCTTCNQIKPLNKFGKDKHKPDGLRGQCKTCRTAIHRKANREWAQRHPEKRKKNDRAKLLRQKYDLTMLEYERLAETQNQVCAICKQPESREGYSLAVDHSHKTGEVRGLLCNRCNRALGLLRENLTEAVRYLEK
jgi:hypothetical protein